MMVETEVGDEAVQDAGGASVLGQEDFHEYPESVYDDQGHALGWLDEGNFSELRAEGRSACLVDVRMSFCTHIQPDAVLERIERVMVEESDIDESLLVDDQGRDVPVVQLYGRVSLAPPGPRHYALYFLVYVAGDWTPDKVEFRTGFDNMLRTMPGRQCTCWDQTSVSIVPYVELLDRCLSVGAYKTPNVGCLSAFEDDVRERLGRYRRSRRHLLPRNVTWE